MVGQFETDLRSSSRGAQQTEVELVLPPHINAALTAAGAPGTFANYASLGIRPATELLESAPTRALSDGMSTEAQELHRIISASVRDMVEEGAEV